MWRITSLALLTLLLCFSAFGQSTTVSGQVTDSGSQAWNSGTFTFTFVPSANNPVGPYVWTGGALQTTITGSLSGTGSYSVSIPSNTSISPVNSKWTVQFCPQASSGCFTVSNVNITGGTQTVNATPPAILINLQAVPPPVLAYSTAEVTGAVIGSQFYLLGTGPQICSAVTGNSCTTWGSGGGAASLCSGANCFNPQNYAGFHGNTREVLDASWPGGNNAISCPNSDCGFTPAMNGWLCWAMPASGNAAGPSATGTFGYVSANSATCTASAVISSASGNGMFTWGQDDTPAYLAAAQALYTQPKCGTIIIPAARSMISQGMSFTGTVAGDCAVAVTGQGYASVIELEPGFSFSAVTNNVGCISAGCIFNSGALSQYLYFTVNGEYQSLSGISTSPASNLFTIGAGSYAIGVNLMNWATAASNTPVGLQNLGNFAFSIGTALTNWGNGTFVCNVAYCFYQYDGGTNNSFQTPGGASFYGDLFGGYSGGYIKTGGSGQFRGTATSSNNGPFGSVAVDQGTSTVFDGACIGCLNGAPGANGLGLEVFSTGSGGAAIIHIRGSSTFKGGGSAAAIKVDSGATADIYLDDASTILSSPALINSGTLRLHHRETGTCTFAAATTCTVTFSTTFGNSTLPTFPISPINPGAVTFTITALSTTAATITASASNSLSVGWEAVLN